MAQLYISTGTWQSSAEGESAEAMKLKKYEYAVLQKPEYAKVEELSYAYSAPNFSILF